jgi:hypothetical protein
MTKKELLDAVRTIVQEEVRTQLPTILIEILSEKVESPKSVVTETRSAPTRPAAVARPAAPTPPPAPKKFSNNPALNAILNETVGGVPPEETATPGVIIPKEMINENAALAGVAQAMNRDYRQLIRAADKKAAATRGSSINFQAPVPTSFDQEPS